MSEERLNRHPTLAQSRSVEMHSLIFIAMLVIFSSFAQTSMSKQKDSSPDLSDAENSSICTIAIEPKKYDKRIVRLRAILIKNHTPRVDGGDPFFYDANCINEENFGYAEFGDMDATPPKLLGKKSEREKRDKRGYSRNEVLVVCRVEASANRKGYGHLDWAPFQLTILKLEEIGPVESNVAWPWKKR